MKTPTAELIGFRFLTIALMRAYVVTTEVFCCKCILKNGCESLEEPVAFFKDSFNASD